MEKISSAKVASVLSTVPVLLRTLAKERDDLAVKVASLQRQVDQFKVRERVENLAKEAFDRNLSGLGSSHDECVKTITAALERGKSLDVIEEAVKLSATRGSFGHLSDDPGNSTNSAAQLEQYILGSLG